MIRANDSDRSMPGHRPGFETEPSPFAILRSTTESESEPTSLLKKSKRPALPAFHLLLAHEIVYPLTGKLRGTHDERYDTFRS